MKIEERLIVALDVDNEKKALGIVDGLKDVVKVFKVGSELFTAAGPGIIDSINKKGARVFLDLKFHDIPNTVARAAIAATRCGVFMFNVHSSGGYDMMKKAANTAREEAARLNIEKPVILAVTVLTSIDENALKKIGIDDNMKTQVLRLARLAKEAGLDGVVASPMEISIIREGLGKDFLIVTPGVRPSWAEKGDQKRIATPKEAIKSGADFIVVGRPVIEADDPRSAAKKILDEIRE